MTVYGTIFDNQNNTYVPGASVLLTSSTGLPSGGGTAADNGGYFALTSPELDQGGKLLISAVGYKSALVDPNIFMSTGSFGLDEDPTTLQAVTVTAKLPAKTNATPWLVAGGAGLLLLATTKKKKKKAKVSGIGNIDWSKVAITGGIVIGGYFVGKLILQKLGLLSSGTSVQDKATTDAQAAALAAAKAAAAQKGAAAATYTADQYTGWANDIFALGTSASTVAQADQDSIKWDVIQANTMVDLQSLISAFGTRQAGGIMCQFFQPLGCTSYDLPSFLKAVLDLQHITDINTYLADQNINYVF